MLTSTQRAHLRSMAQNITPIFQIGKNGIGDNQIIDISTALDLHELIKISVLRNAETDAKTVLNAICALTGAEPVTAIGNKVVIYRRSSRETWNISYSDNLASHYPFSISDSALSRQNNNKAFFKANEQ